MGARKTEDGLELRAVLEAGRTYRVRVRAECEDGVSEVSEAVEFTAGFAECCVWRECPGAADEGVRYTVWEEDGRVAEKTGDDTFAMRHSTVVGSAVLPAAVGAASTGARQQQQQKRKKKGRACVVTWGVRE